MAKSKSHKRKSEEDDLSSGTYTSDLSTEKDGEDLSGSSDEIGSSTGTEGSFENEQSTTIEEEDSTFDGMDNNSDSETYTTDESDEEDLSSNNNSQSSNSSA